MAKKKKPVEKKKKIVIEDNIKTITVIPPGYIPARLFAEKCGITPAGLTLAKNAGKFPSSGMRWVKQAKHRPHLYYHWDSLGPEFIRSRDPKRWPDWFKDIEEKTRKATTGEHEVAKDANPTGSGVHTKMGTALVVDLNSAKFRSEQLKIERQELEIQEAKNQVLDIEEVAGVLAEVGTDIKQSLLAIAPRIAPLVAAETNPHKCLVILEAEINSTLKGLSTLELFMDQKQKQKG